MIAFFLNDFRARRVCGAALLQEKRFQFFSIKDSLDFLYLTVTYLSIFMNSAVFWFTLRARHNTKNRWKYKAMLHNKQSDKLFVIQLLFFFLTSVSHDPISNTLCDYFSCLQVSLALYTLNMRGESQKRNQQAFFLFEMRDNE